MLVDLLPQGGGQGSGVQAQVGAAGLERLGPQQVPALGLPLLVHLLEHLTQEGHAALHLQRAPGRMLGLTSPKRIPQPHVGVNTSRVDTEQ